MERFIKRTSCDRSIIYLEFPYIVHIKILHTLNFIEIFTTRSDGNKGTHSLP